jgi:hypothetical protein
VLDVVDGHLVLQSTHGTGLTVGDVIAMLETFDPSAPLLVAGEYGGLEEVLGLRKINVLLNVNEANGFGPHEIAGPGERADQVAVTLRTAGAAQR